MFCFASVIFWLYIIKACHIMYMVRQTPAHQNDCYKQENQHLNDIKSRTCICMHVCLCARTHALHIPKILFYLGIPRRPIIHGNFLISLFLCFQVFFCSGSPWKVRSHSGFLSSSGLFHLSIDLSKAYCSGKRHQLLFCS